eukprot:TRINITY_DN546_c1_g1_i3.p1 TRINITY_DN546_c1_g1~~TRINITY_DN546_c1_g1_i3.p1  ORF type:complete len:164 (+),score=19.15 TRINITY_DN546_c1_g1_i3:57-548(+)
MRNLLIFLVMLGSSVGYLTTTYDRMTVEEITDPIKCKNNGRWAGLVVSEIACRSTSFTCQLMLAFQEVDYDEFWKSSVRTGYRLPPDNYTKVIQQCRSEFQPNCTEQCQQVYDVCMLKFPGVEKVAECDATELLQKQCEIKCKDAFENAIFNFENYEETINYV